MTDFLDGLLTVTGSAHVQGRGPILNVDDSGKTTPTTGYLTATTLSGLDMPTVRAVFPRGEGRLS